MKKISIDWENRQTYLEKVTKMIEMESRDLSAKIAAQSLSEEEKNELKLKAIKIILD